MRTRHRPKRHIVVWAPGMFYMFLIFLHSTNFYYHCYLITTRATQRRVIDGPHDHDSTPNHHHEQLLAGWKRGAMGTVRGNEPGRTTRSRMEGRDERRECSTNHCHEKSLASHDFCKGCFFCLSLVIFVASLTLCERAGG
jgi:hypothetical protein